MWVVFILSFISFLEISAEWYGHWTDVKSKTEGSPRFLVVSISIFLQAESMSRNSLVYICIRMFTVHILHKYF